ncbi:hypothetical protein ABZW18_00365 [Streptomyces sp. NPDC004647]|uniref:hypothetical protein n=1 Tax=Streptomyces sp. NPDC004647 TaxID=3154671 RepID=UPI0033AABAE1
MHAAQEFITIAAGIGGLVDDIAPEWAEFGALGDRARTVIGVIMAGAILFLLGSSIVGAVHIRVGNQQHNTMETKKGQTMVASSLLGLFVIASMATIFGIVYGMGI